MLFLLIFGIAAFSVIMAHFTSSPFPPLPPSTHRHPEPARIAGGYPRSKDIPAPVCCDDEAVAYNEGWLCIWCESEFSLYAGVLTPRGIVEPGTLTIGTHSTGAR